MPPTYNKENMFIGDGYMLWAMFGTRGALALHFHESGELLMHATDAATPEVEIADTFHDLFTNIAAGDLPNIDTFGGTDVAGTKLTIERGMLENEISQEQAPIESIIISEKAIIELVLKETTLTRLALLWGMLPSDVTNITPAEWDEGDIASLDQLGVGGISIMPFFSSGLRVQNNRAAAGGETLYDFWYFPNCQVDPASEITFLKNDFVKLNAKIHLGPSAQLHELTAGSYTFTDPSNTKVYYTMRSREGKGQLFKVFRGKSS